jgi:hypothetical protein
MVLIFYTVIFEFAHAVFVVPVQMYKLKIERTIVKNTCYHQVVSVTAAHARGN